MDQKSMTTHLVCVLLLTCSNAPDSSRRRVVAATPSYALRPMSHRTATRCEAFRHVANRQLEKERLDQRGNPLESPIWVKVNAGKMPPPTAKPLTDADKASMKQLLVELGEPTTDRGKRPVQTMQEYVEQNKDLTSFVEWAKLSKVWDDLPTTGSYTIFVPTNQAVADLGESNLTFLTILRPTPNSR